MTKADLIQNVHEKVDDLDKQQVEIAVNLVFQTIKKGVKQDNRVDIRDFGNFTIRIRDSKTGRNPKTGTLVKIPSKKVPFFKVGKEMKDMIDN